jgi:hypothetical protein
VPTTQIGEFVEIWHITEAKATEIQLLQKPRLHICPCLTHDLSGFIIRESEGSSAIIQNGAHVIRVGQFSLTNLCSFAYQRKLRLQASASKATLISKDSMNGFW